MRVRWRGEWCVAPGKEALRMLERAVRFRYEGLDALGRKHKLVLAGVVTEVQPWHPRRTHRFVVTTGDGTQYLVSKEQIL